MKYDLIVDTVMLDCGWFRITLLEARTNRLLYRSPSLSAGNCVSAAQYIYRLARSQGYKVQVQVCEELVDIARQVVASLN